MDKGSSLVKTILNNEQIVEKAEKIAEALDFFDKNKSIQTFAYIQPILFSSLELLREYYSEGMAKHFPTSFFQNKTENKLKNK
jgi:hypothetical protein